MIDTSIEMFAEDYYIKDLKYLKQIIIFPGSFSPHDVQIYVT
jgi:hypothetical protein